MKRLIIRHFGPIEDADIKLKRVNLFIGPQSSGKSTALKIACFCDWMEKQLELSQDPDKYCDPAFFYENLIGYHKLKGYMKPDSFIRYENDALSFEYLHGAGKCNFRWKESKRWRYKRVKISYIPAERNLIAAIPNWYQISRENDSILEFMQDWDFARKSFPKGERILDLAASYAYNTNTQTDSIRLENGKELDLTVTSSGLQSLTPLFIVLRYLTSEYFKGIHNSIEKRWLRDNLERVVATDCSALSEKQRREIVERFMTPHNSDLFIEEPEAHIFPTTQKSFVYSLVRMLNGNHRHSCYIATHSPYILTSFNNVILAGERAAESKDIAEKVYALMPKRQTLKYELVSAYEMRNGVARSILDEESRLISADAIDSASKEIGEDFDYLLDL